MKTRLIDIAQAAHVSESTVSRVLAGKHGVNSETREKVLAIAQRLGRTVDPATQFATPLVGLVIPSIENPVFPQFLEYLEAEAFASGLDVLVALNARSVENEAASCERLVHAGAQSLVIVSGQHAHDETDITHYLSLARRGIRMCLINGVREGIAANFISTDDGVAISLALEHLRKLGHRRIGLAVGDEHSFPVRGKVEAFEREWPADARHIAFTDFSFAGGYQAARELHRGDCTAIVCGSDQMAMGVIRALEDMGLGVPEDISVVGYDDIPGARIHSPTITTLRQPLQLMSRAAIRSIQGDPAESRQSAHSVFTVQPELVMRASTAPPAKVRARS